MTTFVDLNGHVDSTGNGLSAIFIFKVSLSLSGQQKYLTICGFGMVLPVGRWVAKYSQSYRRWLGLGCHCLRRANMYQSCSLVVFDRIGKGLSLLL